MTITDECTDRLTHETIKMLTKYVGVIICWALLFRIIIITNFLTGPNFVYFGGQKYGYRPIPTFIPTQVQTYSSLGKQI